MLELDKKATWKRVKQELKRGTQVRQKENYKQKDCKLIYMESKTGMLSMATAMVDTKEHLVAGCKVMANSEYLVRNNRALMVMTIA